jgi:hypothetical protein
MSRRVPPLETNAVFAAFDHPYVYVDEFAALPGVRAVSSS